MHTTYSDKDISENNLKLTFHTKLLTFIFSAGLFMVFGIAYFAIEGLKDDFDNSFPDPLDEISLLNDFQSQYMLETIDVLQNQKIQKYLNHAESISYWQNYKPMEEKIANRSGFFASLRELYQITFLRIKFDEIQTLKNTKAQLIAKLDNIVKLDLMNIDFDDQQKILENAQKVNQYCADIVNTQADIHRLEKETTDNFHFATMGMLCGTTALIFAIVIISNLTIINFIRRINIHLNNLFKSATKELQEINSDLQKKIDTQVEAIREKDQLMYAQAKLASMGEMLQNIAHQWRQPLNSMTLAVQAIKIKFDNNTLTKEIVHEQTKTALNLAQTMSATIDNFRNFFRPETTLEYFEIPDAIKHAINLNKPVFNSLQIQIHLDYDGSPIIYGSKQALTQILLVFFSNSKDAFEEKKLTNRHCFISLESNDKVCVIRFYDNAGGINEDIIHKLFEPYFTTKHQNLGTGIGLYMARELATKHLQGGITVGNHEFIYENQYQKGALFVLELQITNKI